MRSHGNDQLGALLGRHEHRHVLACGRGGYQLVLQAQRVEPLAPGRAAVRIGVDDQLGAAAERGVRCGVHVPHDHVRLESGLEDRVGPAVDGHQDGSHVAHVRAEDAQVLLVVLRVLPGDVVARDFLQHFITQEGDFAANVRKTSVGSRVLERAARIGQIPVRGAVGAVDEELHRHRSAPADRREHLPGGAHG